MTSDVIDGAQFFALARRMETPPVKIRHGYDRTLRVVMWSDAFLSVAFVVICLVAVPVIATLGLPSHALEAVALSAVVCGVLLAAFGAVTAVALMLRLHSGHFQLPPRLWLPLPPGMRPVEYRPRRLRERSTAGEVPQS
jgi:hypothetical protein